MNRTFLLLADLFLFLFFAKLLFVTSASLHCVMSTAVVGGRASLLEAHP